MKVKIINWKGHTERYAFLTKLCLWFVQVWFLFSANETLMKQVSMSTGETTFDKQLSTAAGQM